MARNNRVDLTNMIMIYREDGSFLVQNRKKNDWPGINFPGGHIEDDEDILGSVIREAKEETGLTISHLEFCGYYEWNVPDKRIRYVTMLFRTSHYEGELKKSSEGDVFWLREEDLVSYPLSTDFDKILILMKSGFTLDKIR